MKKFSLIAYCLTSLAVSTSLAKSGDIYVGAGLGYGFIPGDYSLRLSNNALSSDFFNSSANSKVGDVMVYNGVVGYGLTDHIRAELGYTGVANQTIDGTFEMGRRSALNFKRSSYIGMVNIYFDLINSSRFTPFIGAAVGYGGSTLSVDIPKTEGVLTENISITRSKGSTIYGASAGISYAINDKMKLDISYRLNSLARFETEVQGNVVTSTIPNGFPTSTPTATKLGTFKAPSLLHAVNLGVRYVF